MKSKYLFLAASSILSGTMWANVNGTVTDNSGQPLPGAAVIWDGFSTATVTDSIGNFSLPKPQGAHCLLIQYVGMHTDTIHGPADGSHLKIEMHPSTEMKEVKVVGHPFGTMKMGKALLNSDMISSRELLRAACCNLGESFTTNPSVDVSYADAATGAKQIKLLGLSGTYVQMLSENIPNYRGAATPFALSYIPGTWMQSIQVSKGSASVKNGYESITGQINVEFKKPQAPQSVNANLYLNSQLKLEANADANVHINQRLSTAVLAHYENSLMTHDDNNDGFIDLPGIKQYSLQNRWMWMGDKYIFQASVKGMKEDRTGGQKEGHTHSAGPLYTVGISTDRYEAFTKNAFILNKEKNTNIALILAGTLHNEDAGYGHKIYDVNEKNGYASLMFESNFDKHNSLSAGLSLNHDYFDQTYRLVNVADAPQIKNIDKETVPGAYAQYTYNLNDKFLVMGGIRADHSSRYGTFVTPRAHLKWSPSDIVSFRLSAGKGYRTPHALAENNYLLASGRNIIVDPDLKQEEAWNYGISTAFTIPVASKNLIINAEYYYTDFSNQMVIDMDSDPHTVRFSNLNGQSYSHTVQAEVTYPVLTGLNLTAAYRYTDVKTTYGTRLLERPLTGTSKGLITASYQTPMGIWQFDVTLQLNSGGRMPTPYTTADGNLSWPERFSAYPQLSAQATRWFRHWSVYVGGENLTNYKQRNPIVNASDPWSPNFDSTMIWGPVHGFLLYAGVRFNLDYK